MKGDRENILSIGDKIDEKTHYRFKIELGFNHLKNVTFLTIYNITSKDQKMFKCYITIQECNQSRRAIEYKYNIRLASKSTLRFWLFSSFEVRTMPIMANNHFLLTLVDFVSLISKRHPSS